METNLEEVREIAKLFLHMPIKTNRYLPPQVHVDHPIISSSIVYTGTKISDIIANPDDLVEYINLMEKAINDIDLIRIFVLIRKQYRLTFIKFCEDYLSEKDLAELLADGWTTSENPNQDVNCSISYLTKLFRKCNKQYLMQEDDYEVYQSLPDTFVIYRGVAVGRNPNGLSWTQNLKTAKWFAHRFDTDKEKGYIQTAIAKKENVLAYFNTRNEDEIVYDSKKLEISILDEV